MRPASTGAPGAPSSTEATPPTPGRRLTRIGTLYDLLGVAPDASTSTIRDAYRRAARAHHPDRHGAEASDRMAAVNHAWQVLGDPQRRREYDLSLREPVVTSSAAGSATTAPQYSAEPAFNPLSRYQDPPRFPWRLMAVLALMGTALVILGYATAGNPRPPTVDNVLEPGDCVAIQANGDAAERLCSEPHDAVVELLVTAGEQCPGESEPHRDLLGLGTACVRRN